MMDHLAPYGYLLLFRGKSYRLAHAFMKERSAPVPQNFLAVRPVSVGKVSC